jgi:hypothetical protein
MSRFFPVSLAGLIVFAVAARAEGPAGTWKLALPDGQLTFLIQLEEKAGKWSGKLLGISIPDAEKIAVADVVVTPDRLRLALRVVGRSAEFSFDGKLPPDPKAGHVSGSLLMPDGQVFLLQMAPSKLKSLEVFDFAKETIETSSDSQILTKAAIDLLKQASERQAKIEEVRGWADKAFKSADNYGMRWQRGVATRLAQALAPQKDFGTLAVEYARKAERLLDETDDLAAQMDVLEALVQVMSQTGKAVDSKELLVRLIKLEERDFSEYQKKAPFKAESFEARKGKSERAVLVELFTGAECPPCVAADAAFDALERTYKPSEVILLQYHVHVPGPDPLSTRETMSRLEYYVSKAKIRPSAPTIIFNGKPGASGGGPLQAGRKKYAEFRDVIEPLLEKAAEAKIQLSATRKGNEISIKANVSDLAKPGETLRLRFMLVEDHVRYQGGNGMRYHHCVVRAFPGGPNGVALTKKTSEHEAKINLEELRTKLNQYLDEFAKNEAEFPRSERPMSMKNLRVVAIVQDDDAGDVLQATQVEVKE